MRPLTKAEADLLTALIDMMPDGARIRRQIAGARVQEMKDSRMGSLRFINGGSHRMHGEPIAAKATDEDGVPLEISINLDENGDLFELDIWKVDFSPLRRLPEPAQVQRV